MISGLALISAHATDAAVHDGLALFDQALQGGLFSLDPHVQLGEAAQFQFIRKPQPCSMQTERRRFWTAVVSSFSGGLCSGGHCTGVAGLDGVVGVHR
ncbi:hypothetical protein [Pacificibacter marinus]|uniref:Uncharacterized protein n=1 Tax=Pacificibacter marinus TaxID=658057 RepID=A0A1Y5TLK5_9RHOB|nr:hypothetical protein [Pacificibacter marinus]SEL28680.1 hypothetical protein SAMN04488032_11646 [Pacificibacter marinus]SLN66791.1 hypothetical protein PAM7971_03523 [Pacificibacter marinus]